MESTCSLHCGHFHAVGRDAWEKRGKELEGLFRYVHYDPDSATLEVAGGVNIPHDPERLTVIFDTLATMLGPDGKGRIMLQCGVTEVCYFRRNAWKLVHVELPLDPFEGVRKVPG